MPDGNSVSAHQNFLDQEPQNFLSLRQFHGFGLRLEALAELRQCMREPQISRLIRSGQFHGGQFGLYRLLLLSQLRHASPQLRERHQALLVCGQQALRAGL
jgi:hypothetical protein